MGELVDRVQGIINDRDDLWDRLLAVTDERDQLAARVCALEEQVSGFEDLLDRLQEGEGHLREAYRDVVAERDLYLLITIPEAARRLNEQTAACAAERVRANDAENERDRLRAQAEELHHALDHVLACPVACEGCRRIAQSAMDHENLADYMSGD